MLSITVFLDCSTAFKTSETISDSAECNFYGSDAVVTQVLTPAVLSQGSQQRLFPFAENMSIQKLDKT